MQIELKELNKIKGSLAKLLTAPNIPARVAWRANKFSKRVSSEIESIEDARVKLVKQYGEVTPDGTVRVGPKSEAAFEAAFVELLEEIVELPDTQISVDDLKDAGLTMLDFANLDFMIVETDPTERK